MKISLREKLILFAKGKSPHYFNGGAAELLAQNEGYKASNASRRLRELENAGVLERRMAGKSVEYRLKPQNAIYRPEFIREKRLELAKIL